MAQSEAGGVYRTSMTGAGALIIAPGDGDPRAARLTVSGYRGMPVPVDIRDPRVERIDDSGRWRLTCLEGTFDFDARGVEVHQALPGLFDGMLREYTLRNRDKAVVRWLLRLLRLPGGAKLLRAWHARRAH